MSLAGVNTGQWARRARISPLSGGPASAAGNGTPDTTTAAVDPDGEQDTGPGQPPRPRGNAPRAAWAAYAVALGVATEADAATLTRNELKELVTPPEMRPPDLDE